MSQTHCLFVVRRVHLEMYYGAMLIRIVNYGIRLNSFVAIVPHRATEPTYDDDRMRSRCSGIHQLLSTGRLIFGAA